MLNNETVAFDKNTNESEEEANKINISYVNSTFWFHQPKVGAFYRFRGEINAEYSDCTYSKHDFNKNWDKAMR